MRPSQAAMLGHVGRRESRVAEVRRHPGDGEIGDREIAPAQERARRELGFEEREHGSELRVLPIGRGRRRGHDVRQEPMSDARRENGGERRLPRRCLPEQPAQDSGARARLRREEARAAVLLGDVHQHRVRLDEREAAVDERGDLAERVDREIPGRASVAPVHVHDPDLGLEAERVAQRKGLPPVRRQRRGVEREHRTSAYHRSARRALTSARRESPLPSGRAIPPRADSRCTARAGSASRAPARA